MTQCAELSEKISRKESIFAVLYFILYMAYLFATLEDEILHWVTLVIVPFILILAYRKASTPDQTVSSTLASIGLSKSRLRNGIGLAVLVGLGMSLLQLVMSESAGEIVKVFTSGQFLILMPLVFIMMLVTAGFTEEFFFRGILQTRLQVLLGSKTLAIVVAAFCFGLYHLPYAFLNPDWPTHGDFIAALGSALFQGGVGGLILGWLYTRSGKNLVACVVAHSLINMLPGMSMIHFGG